MFILFMVRSLTAKMCFYLPTDDIYPLYGKKYFYTNPTNFPIQYITPSSQLVKIPYKITGPAMVNILAPTPRTNPSLLNSSAGDTMAFANPVMGTTVPAPACFAMLSNKPKPVSNAERKISVHEARVPASSSDNPRV